MDKMSMESSNLSQRSIAADGVSFPNYIIETCRADRVIRCIINIDMLRQTPIDEMIAG